MALSRTLGQRAEVTGMWETSLWFWRNPLAFRSTHGSAVPYILPLPSTNLSALLLDIEFSRNLLDKRSWGFLEPFFHAAVITKFIPVCRGKSNLNYSTSEALML